MDSLQEAESHQGVILVVGHPGAAADFSPSVEAGATLLIASGVQDPGNAGALVRVADAAGAAGVIIAGGADPFGPKAIRASAGSVFRLPILRLAGTPPLIEEIARLRAGGLAVIGAVPRGGRDYRELLPGDRVALVLGGEGAGLAPPLIAAMDHLVTIPLREGVESINVTSAAAVLLFGFARRHAAPSN